MPHLVILYTANLDTEADVPGLCRVLADTMLQVRDEKGDQVFPTGGTRVLAYPAQHFAVADGQRDYGFIYLNLRMAAGRSEAVKKQTGDTVLAAAKRHLAAVFESRLVGMTLQVDENPGQVYEGRHGNIHPLFSR